jgi:hypothetical protein
MRQFRTSTDSVFDIDDEDTRAVSVVPQAGPPAEEGIVVEQPAGSSDAPQDD